MRPFDMIAIPLLPMNIVSITRDVVFRGTKRYLLLTFLLSSGHESCISQQKGSFFTF
jgi:hypothetical protein